MKNRRIRIAFITQTAYQNFQSDMLSGVIEAAEKYDADIIRFSLSVNIDYFPDEDMLEKILETICMISEKLDIDGLLLLNWIAPPEIVTKYLKEKSGIPIVILGKNHKDYPSVYQNGEFYIKELVRHLREVHDRKNIVYIEPTNPDTRIDSYIEQMKEYGVFNPECIISNRDIGHKPYFGFFDRADRIISCIFDEKKLKPDGMLVMHSNDTVGIIERLVSTGIRVPEDISIVSWEEGDLCRYNDPPVTTVYFPFREMGYMGCDMLARILKGEKTEKSCIAPSRIIRRDSCGCSHHLKNRVKILPEIKTGKETAALLKENLSILDADELFGNFSLAVKNNNSESFTEWLDKYLDSYYFPAEHIRMVQEDILFLRRLIDESADGIYGQNRTINEIWVKSLLLLNSKIESILGKKEQYKQQINSKAQRINLYLNTMFNLDRIKTVLSKYLPKIRIDKCIIYDISRRGNGRMESRLLFNLSEGIEQPAEGQPYGNQLFNSEKRQTYNVHLLQVNEDIIGCIFFDYALKDDWIYLTLATQLASAINGTRTLEILKNSVDEKEMLMKELQHRVKNNLVTIISMLDLQSDKIKDENTKRIFLDANNKIRSMSLIYDRLYKPSSNLKDVRLDEYLLSLASQLLGFFDFSTNKVTLTTDLDRLTVDMKRCVYIGLLTNEIITNSFKYAFPDREGKINIRLKKNGSSVLLEFTDDGIGIGDKYEPDSIDHFGLNLVKINVGQLNGTMEIDNIKSGGTRVSINFPVT